jgi:hypothetical protein
LIIRQRWERESERKDLYMSIGWWKTKNQNWGIYTSHRHWVGRGTGTPKDKVEVNRREVSECEGWVWDLDTRGAPDRLRLIRKTTVLVRLCTRSVLSGN